MIELLERLNVRPEERRVAICIFFGVFIVINGLWAWRFIAGETEWTELKSDIQQDSDESAALRAALTDLKQKQSDWEEYARSMGADAGGERAWTDLHTKVRKLARDHKLKIGRSTPSKIDDPEFTAFKKHTVNLDFTASDNSLVNYLVALAREPQMVRVSSLTLRRPNNNQKILTGTISVVASFPKEEEKKEPEVKDKKI